MSTIDDFVVRFETAFDMLRRQQTHRFKEKIDELKLGLTGPQFYMLHLLAELQPVKSTVLAEKMDVKPSAITVMIDRLVQSGFASRHPDEHDRRVVLVRLTESGRSAMEKLNGIRRDMIKQLFSGLTHDEMGTYITLFEKMTSSYTKNEQE